MSTSVFQSETIEKERGILWWNCQKISSSSLSILVWKEFNIFVNCVKEEPSSKVLLFFPCQCVKIQSKNTIAFLLVNMIILSLSVVQQNIRVTRRIVLPLLTKALYKFGCFEGILQKVKLALLLFYWVWHDFAWSTFKSRLTFTYWYISFKLDSSLGRIQIGLLYRNYKNLTINFQLKLHKYHNNESLKVQARKRNM